MGILTAIGEWILKIFLGGLFGQANTRLEEENKQTRDAAVLHAESTKEAAKVEIDIAKAQEVVKDKYRDQKNDPDDPFHVNDWNKK